MSPVVPSERGIVAIRPSGDQTAQCPTESNNGVLYKIYIYLHQYTIRHSSRVLVSAARHPNIDSLTSSYRDTARSVAVRHTSWLRPLRPFPLNPCPRRQRPRRHYVAPTGTCTLNRSNFYIGI